MGRGWDRMGVGNNLSPAYALICTKLPFLPVFSFSLFYVSFLHTIVMVLIFSFGSVSAVCLRFMAISGLVVQ